jgi:hypothetical protein
MHLEKVVGQKVLQISNREVGKQISTPFFPVTFLLAIFSSFFLSGFETSIKFCVF